MNRKTLFYNILIVMLYVLAAVPLHAQSNIVHAYTPFTIPAKGPGGVAYPSHVRNDAISTRFGVKVADVSVPAICYDNNVNGNQGHNMDVARFASNSLTPKIEINVMGGTEINSVTIHPVQFYPQKAITISADRRTLTFEMVKNLPYAIVIINGDDPQDASTTNPQLTLINDPLEDPAKKPSLSAPNVCAGLQGFMLVNAAEIMRYTYATAQYPDGWSEQDTECVEAMFRNVFQPVLSKFFQTAPYTNGNWGIAVAKAQLSFGIFLNDRKLYDDAIDFFHHGKDNGSLPNYIAESGQSQEAGRDQQHAMLGVACFADMAEVAWTQGIDLYSALDNRILKGYEYLAKSNLGYDVPFVTWKDITGKYSNLSTFGKDGMGRFRSVFEIAYNHYVVRKGLEMPYTKIVLGLVRPEGPGFTCDNTGFGSLLYYLGDDLNTGKEKGRIQEDLTQLKAWTFSTASYRAVNGVMSFVSSGIKLQKRVQYNPSAYPNIVVKAPGVPASANKKWLTLLYSIHAAPEYWELDSDKAMKVGEDMYVFKITDYQSHNGYSFSTTPTNITITLDFGDTCKEPVVVEWIQSFTDAELQAYPELNKGGK